MKRATGNFMIEAVLVVFIVVMMQLLLIEGIRRSVFKIIQSHLACEEVRKKSLGARAAAIQAGSSKFLNTALNKNLAMFLMRKSIPKHFQLYDYLTLKRLNLNEQGGGVTERILRYPQLMVFEMKNKKLKHHQEIAVRCSFPFSS